MACVSEGGDWSLPEQLQKYRRAEKLERKIRKTRASFIFLWVLSPSSCHALPAGSVSGRAGCCDRWTGAAQRNGFRWAICCELVELLQSHKCKELEAILLQTLGSWKPGPSFYKALLKIPLPPLPVAVSLLIPFVHWGCGTVTKAGNTIYGALCGSAPSQPGALSEANKQSYKRQVQRLPLSFHFPLCGAFLMSSSCCPLPF